MGKKPKHPSYDPNDEKEKAAVVAERQKVLLALYAAQQRLLDIGDSTNADTLIKLSHAIFGLGEGRVAPVLRKNPVDHHPGTNSYEANGYAISAALIDYWMSPSRSDRLTREKALDKASKLLKKACGIDCTPAALKKWRTKIKNPKPSGSHPSQVYHYANTLLRQDGIDDAEAQIIQYLKQR
jgi:hypothetical protein